jgi:hypothetical protein
MTWQPSSFEEFWPYYVTQHQNPINRALHFVGTSAALGCLAVTPLIPPALLAAPVAGYGAAWIGHFVFEKNRPATFGHPLWSLRGDLKMYRLMWTRKMAAELERASTFAAELATPVDAAAAA